MTAPLTPHAKAWNLLSRRRPRRGRASKPTPCGIADCPGWKVVNSDIDPEIQRCDACWQDFADDEQLTDSEAALLEGARVALREARAALAQRRELAIARRRVAIVQNDTLVSPCCRRPVEEWREVFSRHVGDLDSIDRDAACSACGRLLQLPAGFVL